MIFCKTAVFSFLLILYKYSGVKWMKSDCIQLEMNFEGNTENIFRKRLNNGEFQVLAEIALPSANARVREEAEKYAEYEMIALRSKMPAGLALVDEYPSPEGSVDPVLFAMELCHTNRDHHLFYVNGRNRSVQNQYEIIRVARGEGFKNFCAVSGTPVAYEDAKETARRRFAESVLLLDRLRQDPIDGVYAGCSVNPYKYTASDLCMQNFKLIKKINCGAAFAVTQYGWDLMKLQELRWYLSHRAAHIPMLARLLFLTPERAEAICAGRVPGVHISPDFAKLLGREMQHSRYQFEAAQLRRLEIHAVGACLLGYSGVQIAGIDRPEQFSALLERIGNAMREFPDFESWRTMYRQYYERLDMAPYPHRFYFFKNLFSTSQPPDEPQINDSGIPDCTSSERIAYKIGNAMFSHAGELPASERRLTKKLLFNCKSCNCCRLPETFYICTENCPMKLANGPCGASNADGSCFFSTEKEQKACIYQKQMRIVNMLRGYPALEERIVPDGLNKI